jgi:hypothetical protein
MTRRKCNLFNPAKIIVEEMQSSISQGCFLIVSIIKNEQCKRTKDYTRENVGGVEDGREWTCNPNSLDLDDHHTLDE